MPAAFIVFDAVIAPAIASVVPEAILGSTLLADAVTGLAVGAVGGAAQAAVTGEDIGKGALKGAEMGTIGGVAGELALSGLDAASKGWTTANPQAAGAVATGVGTTAAQLATGASGKQALEAGLIGGVSEYAGSKIAPGEGAQKALERSVIQQETSRGLGQLLAPKQQAPAYTPPQVGTTMSGQSAQPSAGSAALAQALRVGDAGGPIFGASGEQKGKKRGAWNIESLKYMGGGQGG